MKKQSNLKRLLSYISLYKKGFIISLTLVLILVATNAMFPYVTRLAITEISRNVVDMINGVAGATINFLMY